MYIRKCKFSSLQHGVSLIPINVNAAQLSSCRCSRNPKFVFTDQNSRESALKFIAFTPVKRTIVFTVTYDIFQIK